MVTFVQKHVRVSATPAACAAFAALVACMIPGQSRAQAAPEAIPQSRSVADRSSTATASHIDARVSRSHVTPGEPFELQLRSSGAGSADDLSQLPDPSALENDFEILGTSRSVRVSVVNGRYDNSTDWTITLAAKRSGSLEIPSLATAAGVTEAIVMQVSAASHRQDRDSDGDNLGPELFIETDIATSTPYVQGETRMSLRIHSSRPILKGGISDPYADGVTITRVGDDRVSRQELDGRTFDVLERNYAIVPQRSGRIEIEGAVFEGAVEGALRGGRDAASRSNFGRSPFGSHAARSLLDDFFGSDPFADGFFDRISASRAQPVRARAENIVLEARERPESAGAGWWLPAQAVELVEQWEPEATALTVGDQLTRTIVIRAEGASDEQLPRLDPPAANGAKQYSQPKGAQTFVADGKTVGVKAVETVIIPTRAGRIELPAIEVEWWDTNIEERRIASLPASTLEVSGGDAAAPVDIGGMTDAGDAGGAGGAGNELADAGSDTAAVTSDTRIGAHPLVRVSALCALALAFSVAVVASRRRKRRGAAAVAEAAVQHDSAMTPAGRVRKLERSLHASCRHGESRRARTLLLELGYARTARPGDAPVGPLGSEPCGPRLAAELAELDRFCFGRRTDRTATTGRAAAAESAWSGERLWQAYRREASRAKKYASERSGAGQPLPDLYPAP